VAAAGLAVLAVLLRPWPPFQALPGWCLAALLLWAVIEALLWQWRPRRWR
jgi:MFS superfamily sulfate permease-like transporter